MDFVEGLIYLTGVYPLARAWVANRDTSLLHALTWAAAAWLAWAVVVWSAEPAAAIRFLALALTGCAAIAVLGARRPIVGPWNFVVFGLLAVLLLPLAENVLVGAPLLDPLRLVFIAGTLVVGVLNYLPTRAAPAVLLTGLACGGEMALLNGAVDADWREALANADRRLLAVACWVGWLTMARRWQGVAEFDREWLTFRDRFGLMWGQRLREQFNRAADNAGWPVILRWSGLRKTSRERPLSVADQTAIVDTLRAMLKRFGRAGDQ
jgi:hypothetical protein